MSAAPYKELTPQAIAKQCTGASSQSSPKVSPIMPEEQKNHVKGLSTAVTLVINKDYGRKSKARKEIRVRVRGETTAIAGKSAPLSVTNHDQPLAPIVCA